MSKNFDIQFYNVHWKGESSESDYCLHGQVIILINNIPVIDKYECTISSMAISLLRSIGSNHIQIKR